MKKLIFSIALSVGLLASLSLAGTHVGPVGTGGYQIGKTAAELIGLWGHATVAQPANTAPTRTALQAFGGQAVDVTITATATGTSGTSTVTLNTPLGVITTDAITTAAAATHVMTVTDSTVTATSIIHASVSQNGSTGLPVITSIEPGSGSFIVRVTNLHASAAFNAALKIAFEVVK